MIYPPCLSTIGTFPFQDYYVTVLQHIFLYLIDEYRLGVKFNNCVNTICFRIIICSSRKRGESRKANKAKRAFPHKHSNTRVFFQCIFCRVENSLLYPHPSLRRRVFHFSIGSAYVRDESYSDAALR